MNFLKTVATAKMIYDVAIIANNLLEKHKSSKNECNSKVYILI